MRRVGLLQVAGVEVPVFTVTRQWLEDALGPGLDPKGIFIYDAPAILLRNDLAQSMLRVTILHELSHAAFAILSRSLGLKEIHEDCGEDHDNDSVREEFACEASAQAVAQNWMEIERITKAAYRPPLKRRKKC
jgi:hypothetical protein